MRAVHRQQRQPAGRQNPAQLLEPQAGHAAVQMAEHRDRVHQIEVPVLVGQRRKKRRQRPAQGAVVAGRPVDRSRIDVAAETRRLGRQRREMGQHPPRPAAEVQHRAQLPRVPAGGAHEPGQLRRRLAPTLGKGVPPGGPGPRAQAARRHGAPGRRSGRRTVAQERVGQFARAPQDPAHGGRGLPGSRDGLDRPQGRRRAPAHQWQDGGPDGARVTARPDQPALRVRAAPELARGDPRAGRAGLCVHLPQPGPVSVAVVLGLLLSRDRVAAL